MRPERRRVHHDSRSGADVPSPASTRPSRPERRRTRRPTRRRGPKDAPRDDARAPPRPRPRSKTPEGRGQPAPRRPPPRARPRSEHARPVRGDRRPRPSQGRPRPLPAVADEPPAARVRPPRDRPARVRRRRPPRRSSGRPSRSTRASCRSTMRPGGRSRRGSATSAATSPTPPTSTELANVLEEIDREQNSRGNHLFYLATQPSAFAEIVGPARPGRARPRAPRGRLAAGRHREAVRPRPPVGDPPQPRGRQGLPRVAGLPDRSLPGQGDRPEPAGLPVRQRDLRADLEPAPHRPRPDHGGRDRSASRTAARSTRRPGRAATSSRTTCSS